MLDNDEWLKELKPGDKVIVAGNGSAVTDFIRTIERFTKTLIILNPHGAKYNRVTGKETGTKRWNCTYLVEATADRIQAIENRQKRNLLVHKFNTINTNNLSIEQLQQIISITI